MYNIKIILYIALFIIIIIIVVIYIIFKKIIKIIKKSENNEYYLKYIQSNTDMIKKKLSGKYSYNIIYKYGQKYRKK